MTTTASGTPHPESIPRFPLEWPLGWQRARVRRQAQFKTVTHETTPTGTWKRQRQLSMADAVSRLEEQLDKLKIHEAVRSSNVTLTLSGRPRGDELPSDPGVACYFRYNKKPTVLACDTYTRVADNIAAIAAHIEALRAIERYGVGTIEQALAGYKSLPADTAADWRQVLGFGSHNTPTVEEVNKVYRERAKLKHPDVLHDDGASMAHLNRARDYALAELEGR
jgi:hypothetical protein